MKILALLITLYTPLMLVIHLSTGKILHAWNERSDSWINRRLRPQRALRIEALFWLLALAAWSLWRPLAWKIVIIVFAVIHLGVWGAGELIMKGTNALGQTPVVERVILVFDRIEAFVLATVGVFAVLYLIHPT